MKVQCAVLESSLRSQWEAPTRSALRGNEDSPQLDFRTISARIAVPSGSSVQTRVDAATPGYVPTATPYDFAVRNLIKNFQGIHAVYNSIYPATPYLIPPYIGDAGVAGAGMIPTASGWPGPYILGQDPPVVSVQNMLGPTYTSISGDDSLHYDALGQETMDYSLNTPVDYAGLYGRMSADLLAAVFPTNWGDPCPQYVYDFGHPGATGALVNDGFGAGAFPGDYWLTGAGWGAPNVGGISAWRSQVRYRGSTPLFYWFGRARSSGYAFKKGDWFRTDDMISMGFLTPINGQIIIEVPYAPALPYPLGEIGNGAVMGDWNFFAVVNPPHPLGKNQTA